MKMESILTISLVVAFLCMTLFSQNAYAKENYIKETDRQKVIENIVKKYGQAERKTAEIGTKQVAELWLEKDGSGEDYINFCTSHFIEKDDKTTFERLEKNFNTINGHMQEIERKINEPLQLEIGEIHPIDHLFGKLSINSHLSDDYYKTKIAFFILLNYPKTTLADKNENGTKWSREYWSKVRLAEQYSSRIPADVLQKVSNTYLAVENYITAYNIYMYNIITPEGKRLFPKDLRLISHWGLRDEIRGQYKEKDGIQKQQIVQKVMERIISQEIPQEIINSDKYDWEPFANKLYKNGKEIAFKPENGVRYGHLRSIFKMAQLGDEYYPKESNFIDRHFNRQLEIAEKDIEELLMSIISSPQIKQSGKLIEKRLGRKLKPFDIWYTGFSSRPQISEKELDKIVAEKYKTTSDFQKDIPNILMKLGFTPEKAKYMGEKIVVDPSRSAGHAMGAGGREFNAHLRTRAENGKMNYKSYNIACHELGHCVEQVTSTSLIDHTLLMGVPNIAFTEAFAFLFQSRDLELLGLSGNPEKKNEEALETMWSVYEIGGVSIVTMKTWRWMYEHPNATEQEIQVAVTNIAKDMWNKYYEPVFGQKDCTLLAVYSHMIAYDLYLPNYPIGHIIKYQIEDYIKNKNLGSEMLRMCLIGSITPDLWMMQSVGKKITTEPILKNAEKILNKELGK